MCLVSVIIPVYNREHLVGKSIESVIRQTYINWEIILINDGSTDNSLKVLEKYKKRYPNKIKLIDQANTGQALARNIGISAASGQYIAFLDSDDMWGERKLELQIPLFASNEIGLVYSGIVNIDLNSTVINEELCDETLIGDIYSKLLIKNRMTGGSVVVLKKALDKVGLFDESFQAAENWDLWLRIAKYYKVGLVNQPLVYYRKHPGNMSKDIGLMISAKEAILNKHFNSNDNDSRVAASLGEAKADLAYVKGVYHFSNSEYYLARKYFRQALSFNRSYKDARARVIRSYLGRPVNKILSIIKNNLFYKSF